MTRILLSGASGRLGSEIVRAAGEKGLSVVSLNRETVNSSAEMKALLQQGPCFILDVSLPEGTQNLTSTLLRLDAADIAFVLSVVIGTTGHSPEQLLALDKLSKILPISLVSNFSRGIFLFQELLKAKTTSGETFAELAKSLGFDLAIWESHHSKKKDIPSGTARSLALDAGVNSSDIASTRIGDVVGEHILFASGDSEELKITHIAHSRRLFALGALELISKMREAKSIAPGFHDKSEFWSS